MNLEELEALEAEWLRRNYETEPDPNLWKWAPTPLPRFMEMMSYATMAKDIVESEWPPRFFEAGCGIGTKLYIARHEWGMDELGWEIFPEYVEQARKLDVNAEQHDLRTEEPDWASFDIVFISRPFKDDAEEHVWEQKVQDAMRPGAVLIASYAAVKPYSWRWLYKGSWRIVAVKPLPDEARPKFRIEPVSPDTPR
jgi:SAM-dependent methyltransferase